MSEKILRIDYLEFTVRDVSAAKAFYAAAFGWTFTDYGPDYTSFNDGRLAGGFRKTEGKRGTAPEMSGPVLVILFASNLESSESAITAAGGTISRPSFDFPGGRRFHFTDPNGLELAVWSDLRADGSKIA